MRSARWVQSFVVLSFLVIYFASGFSALLYQVIWQRILAIFSGADVFAATTIVASFMAGLGTGSLYGGFRADRLTLRGQIALFAIAECLTGVAGLLSKWWIYDVLYTRFGFLAASPLLLAVVLFTSLLVPTFLMGTTLPLLAKALTPAVASAGRRIGSIYAFNTLGAACGAFVTGWLLMGRWSFPDILRFGAFMNFAVAAWAIVLGFVWQSQSARVFKEDQEREPDAPPPIISFPAWMLVYALSGFLALSLEVLWFRLLGVMLKSNSLTFPHLLGIYLASLAAGILIGVQLVKFGKQPAKTFLMLQSGITIYAGLSLAVLIFGVQHWPSLDWLRKYFDAYAPLESSTVRAAAENLILGGQSLVAAIRGPHPNFLSLYVLLPVSLVVPPTLLMGMSFPFLQRAVQNSRAWIGRRVGWLQAANIFGATLGAICVGGLFLHRLGTTGTLRLLIALGGTFLILRFRGRWIRAGLAAASVFVVVWSIPSRNVLWGSLHGAPAENVVSAEDASGLSVLKNERADFLATTMVYTNGLGQSWIPYTHVGNVHSLLGILPIMLHDDPKEIAVVGLGSGDTLYNLGGRQETQEIVCIEIVAAEIEALRLLHNRRPYPGLENLFNDPRIRYVFRDGRTYIGSSSKKYDIIEADALRPTSAFAGNLYSYEYFELLRNRLKPGGLVVTWAPTPRIMRTFLKVFPHVLDFDSVLIGSSEPISIDRDRIRMRLEHPFTQTYYRKIDLDVTELAMPFFERPMDRVRVDHASYNLTDLNHDLFPKDEYAR